MLNGCVIARRMDTWPISNAAYRGACRGVWWPLKRESDPAAKRITAARDQQMLSTSPSELRVDACLDSSHLRSYIAACDRLKVGELFSFICEDSSVGPEPPAWLAALKHQIHRLGVDVIYESGSFSFVNGAFGAEDEHIKALLRRSLNHNGLFDSFDAARRFMSEYEAALGRGVNLETLDDAMPVELWEDPELLALREMLRG